MSYKKSYSAISILCILTFLFQSCSEDMITQSGIRVTGRLLDSDYQPYPNVTVRIGDKTTTSSSDGYFSFDNVNVPYDISILDYAQKNYYMFKGLTVPYVNVPNFYFNNTLTPTATVLVRIPQEIISGNVKGKIIFTDVNNNNSYYDLSTGNILHIYLPEFNKTYSGRLIVITYKTDNDGIITEYENFGESSTINISSGRTYNYDFTLQDLSFNPGENRISGSFVHPSGFVSNLGYYYLSFTSKRINFYSESLKFMSVGDAFSIVVPVNLPVDYSIMIGNRAVRGSESIFENFKVDKNSKNIILQTQTPPKLIFPENNSSNVNETTIFSYSAGSGAGIYNLWFHNSDDNTHFLICSASSSFMFSELKAFGYSLSDKSFMWVVGKAGPVENMNEYLNSYSESQSYFGSSSELRYFMTAR